MPHDASVFVGSLPTNVDLAELTHMLHEHLSPHAEVRNVKVIRDSKGGACAFVQCEDASAAARLIRNLQSLPPRPFLGRNLRYEPARAFRMLLMSYRRPVRRVTTMGLNDSFESVLNQSTIEPPTAMRIYRPRNSKYLAVSYDAEAREYNVHVAPSQDQANYMSGPDTFSGAGILFDPMKYDAATMLKLASAFGPIEHFGAYASPIELNSNGNREGISVDQSRPHPHDAPRSSDMDPSVWQIKWDHREDCVNALMTLRRVPFMNVSWAHHVASSGIGSASQDSNPVLPERFVSFPPRVRTQSHPHPTPVGDIQRFVPRNHGLLNAAHSRMSTAPSPNDLTTSPEPWAFAHSTPLWRGSFVPQSSESHTHLLGKGQRRSPKWSENDFPPLDAMSPDGTSHFRSEGGSHSWADSVVYEEDSGDLEVGSISSGSPSSSLSVNPSATPAESAGGSHVVDDFRFARSLPISPAHSHYTQTSEEQLTAAMPNAEFSFSSVTPLTPNTGPVLPPSPTSPVDRKINVSSPYYDQFGRRSMERGGSPQQTTDFDSTYQARWSGRSLDPTTIFVGGLEMYGADAWDDSKLRSLFDRFGSIESIQLVRPLNKRSAFAFIQFSDTEAASQAIQAEHNRIYNGRQIRVQLRDSNPPQRNAWRYSRGRGRLSTGPVPPYGHGGSERDHGTRPDAGGCMGADLASQALLDQSHGRPQNLYPALPTTSPSRSTSFSRADDGRPSSGMVVRGDYKHSEMPESSLSSLSSSTTKASFPRFDVPYEQQSGGAVASSTPSPAGSGRPSVSALRTTQPYTVQNIGYSAHQPWMHPYPAHYPYPGSFIPNYPGYLPPSRGPQMTFNASEGAASHGETHQVWHTMGNMYKPMPPYMAYPTTNSSHDQQLQSQPSQPTMQPPLMATGFIQGEHGMLIPVYQPEALHHYMSNADHSQSSPPHMLAPTPPASVWPHYAHLPVYPYALPMQPLVPSQSQQAQAGPQRGWVPNPASFALPVPQVPQLQHAPIPYMLATASSGSLNNTSSFRGPFPGSAQSAQRHGQHNTPPPTRFNRREHMQNGSSYPHRLHNSRASPNRFVNTAGNGMDASYDFAGQGC